MVAIDTGLYVGTFFHNLDTKGRLTIPSKWRFAGDEADVYLGLPNPDGFITVYPPPMIARLREKVSNISLGDSEGQRTLMEISLMAHSFGCDKQGRINLNAQLIGHAKIEKEAVLIGNFTSFSIWGKEAYEQMRQAGIGSLNDNLQKLDL
ncbi:MAG: division/cell wall cluster transcriptional repressor MraZ [Puniceicoccaceae bacterium]